MSTPAPIRVPLRQRLQWLRLRVLPLLIFASALLALELTWSGREDSPVLLGQVEAIQSNVSCYRAGTLSDLCVNRFQQVRAGDILGQVLVTDPRIMASSLEVIVREIEALRVGMQPLLVKQRAALDYSQLRLDWMRQRAQLAEAKANLQFAEADYRRKEELFKEQIVAQRVYEQAQANQNRLRDEVAELTRLVDEQLQNFEQMTNVTDPSKLTDEPLRAAIAAEEAKLNQAEAELSPMPLRAPVDGTISLVFHHSGEAINVGEPVLAITPATAARIISYVRPPVAQTLRLGTAVEVRTRGLSPQVGRAELVELGNQYEPIAPALQAPMRFANLDLGLPIGISLPANLNVRPGELVNLRLLPREKGATRSAVAAH